MDGRRMMRKGLFAVATAIALVPALSATPASALTVSVEQSPYVVRITAGERENNKLHLSLYSNTIGIEGNLGNYPLSFTPVDPSSGGCYVSRPKPLAIHCYSNDSAPMANVIVDLGDGRDKLTSEAAGDDARVPALITGGAGGDRISGAGFGHCVIDGGAGADTIQGCWWGGTLYGGSEADKISLEGLATGCGSTSWHTVFGQGGNDRLTGGPTRDVLFGGPGNDNVTGGQCRDELYGEEGVDRVRADDFGFDVVDCGTNTDGRSERDRARFDFDLDQVTGCEIAR